MDFNVLSFEIARRYVDDYESLLTSGSRNQILGWIRNRDFAKLASCTCTADIASASSASWRVLRQIEALFKKSSIYSDPTVCRQNAVSSFNRAEKLCRITNRRLDYYYSKRDRLDPDLRLWVERSEEWIASTLGSASEFVAGLPELIRFTSGATSEKPRRLSQPHNKMNLKMSLTPGSVRYAKALASFYGCKIFRPKTTPLNRVEFVPKSWKTERTIACEPEGSLPLQLAFDSYAKSRLRKRGIDLSRQERNQSLAWEGSKDGSLATIDLSMASDTLAFNTVSLLLPLEWFEYLNSVRSAFGRSPETGIVKYAKFSSMGNGATFALETLIFASACHAVGSKAYSVYGDDLIIESELAPKLLRYLRFLGFLPNEEKSYLTGPFRESCGKDYFSGTDITPFYLRDWSALKAQICHNVNGLVSVSLPYGRVWQLCRDLISQWSLPYVPYNEDSMSGVHIHVHEAYNLKLFRMKRWIIKFKAYKPETQDLRVYDSRTLFLWHLNRYRSKDKSKEVDFLETSSVPTFSNKYVRKWVLWIPPKVVAPVHVPTWTDFLTSTAELSV